MCVGAGCNLCLGEGGGFVGLDGPRVPPAESSDGSRPEGVPDGQSGGSAEPPRPHAACPEEAHLRQCRRETGQWPRGMMGMGRFRSLTDYPA